MNQSQFIRVESHRSTDIAGILNEADRVPGFCSHIKSPAPAGWGKTKRLDIDRAIQTYRDTKQPVRAKNGKIFYRCPRKDGRFLTTLIASYPLTVEDSKSNHESIGTLKEWARRCWEFVNAELDGYLVATCLHLDEGYPHLHFFAVGTCQHVHPGLKAEIQNGVLMKDRQARVDAHRKALTAFQDRFYEAVSVHFGHQRKSNRPRGVRIKERELYLERLELERLAQLNGDFETVQLFDKMYSLIKGAVGNYTSVDHHQSSDQPTPRG